MKIAIVHDYLNQYGGAERAVEALHEVFPEAPIYTSIYLPKNLPDTFQKMDIRTSFLQNFPFLNEHFKKYLLFYPKAIESFNLVDYDVILSSSSAFAKGAIGGDTTCHICYCYTPMRFVWDYQNYVEHENFGQIIRLLLPPALHLLKSWDLATIKRVNHFIAISESIRKRIMRIYQRPVEVIYPPVKTAQYHLSEMVEDYFLVVSRLNAYKRIDLVIEAFNRLGLPLRIIGVGSHENYLKQIAKQNISFLGKVAEGELVSLYSKCRALIFPGEEDFGIAPVEAQAAGRPVIAYAGGGALETIIDGVTGIFFHQKSSEALVEAIRRFDRVDFKSARIRENAIRFDEETFKIKIKEFVSKKAKEQKAVS